MKTKHSHSLLILTGFFVAMSALGASPLAWFPGPALDAAVSGEASVVISGGDYLELAGDGGYYYAGFPESLAATNSYWTPLPSLFSGTRIGAGAAASGDIIMLYGGTDGTNATSSVIGYSLSGDTLPAMSSMSVERAYLGYASDVSGNAYAVGGLDGNGEPLASAEYFSQDTSYWASISAMPAARFNFPAVFDHTNLIYVFGGSTNASAGSETASVLRYSIRTKTWSTLASMPVATAGSAAAFASDGEFYVAGGTSGGVTTNLVQVYNPASNSWSISTPLPEPLTEFAMGVDSLGRLITMGGIDTNGYDVSDVWRSQMLGKPDVAPTFTQYPATNAFYTNLYTSSISATGNPQATFVLVSGPAGMQVDPFSGAITWTPDAAGIGTNSVTIRATNYAGYIDWAFSIVVPNPPPSEPANLIVTGVTDNSVSLAWNPENAVVGPTTYSFYLRHSIHDPRGSGGSVWYTQIGASTMQTALTISGLTPGLGQTYYILAMAPGGLSGTNTSVYASTTAPQGPTNLTVTGLTSTTVTLSWPPAPGPTQNPLYSAITSYSIMERDVTFFPATNIPTLTNILGTSGTVTGLKPGGSHIWFVSGVDAQGNASGIRWTYVVVTNPAPSAAVLSPSVALSTAGFQLNASQAGSILQTVTIQATTNLTNPDSWTNIGSVLPASNLFRFIDTNATQFPNRFYRIVTQ